jgi:hypothetical protein
MAAVAVIALMVTLESCRASQVAPIKLSTAAVVQHRINVG